MLIERVDLSQEIVYNIKYVFDNLKPKCQRKSSVHVLIKKLAKQYSGFFLYNFFAG